MQITAEVGMSDLTRTGPVPTPTSVFDADLRAGSWFITTTQVDRIAAGTSVQIGSMMYNGADWVYTITTASGVTAQASSDQLSVLATFTPYPTYPPTPTAGFDNVIGMGYTVYLTASYGRIVPGEVVRVSSMWYRDGQWLYQVETPDGRTAEVPQQYLSYYPQTATPASNIPTPTPISPPMTPTPIFYGLLDGPYRLYLVQPTGAISTGDPVRVLELIYNGATWVYTVETADGRRADVPQDNLLYPPPSATPRSPIATPAPIP
jgi:hypothetical protein